jgi:Fe-S cluster biogenesis protein NfuA
LKEYFKGPGATERSSGYSALYNGFSGYSSLEVANGVARLFLSGACSPSGKDFTIADLINLNLKQFSNIQSVKIYDQFGQTQNPDGPGDSEPICLDPSFTVTATPSRTPTASRTPTNTRTPTPTRTPTNTRTPTRTPTASRTPTVTRTPPNTVTPTYTKLNIYFVHKSTLELVTGTRWTVSSANFPKFILDEYFKGPGLTEKNQFGWIAIYSGATGYSKLEITDGIARVYLKGKCDSLGSTFTIATPLNANLKQFSYIQFVKIYDENGTTQDPDGQSDSIPACLEP